MSDGNFNRALLPHTPYASGMNAGKSMTRMHALEAFRQWLRNDQPELSVDEYHQKVEDYRNLLSRLAV